MFFKLWELPLISRLSIDHLTDSTLGDIPLSLDEAGLEPVITYIFWQLVKMHDVILNQLIILGLHVHVELLLVQRLHLLCVDVVLMDASSYPVIERYAAKRSIAVNHMALVIVVRVKPLTWGTGTRLSHKLASQGGLLADFTGLIKVDVSFQAIFRCPQRIIDTLRANFDVMRIDGIQIDTHINILLLGE